MAQYALLLLLPPLLILLLRVSAAPDEPRILKIGSVEEHNKTQTFCFTPAKLQLKDIWLTIHVEVKGKNGDVKLLMGHNATEIQQQVSSWHSWMWRRVSSGSRDVYHYFNLANQTCFCVETSGIYEVKVIRTAFSWRLIGILLFGIILFFYAENLSRSATFFYSSGVLLGIVASLLIIIFVVGRFLPKRSSVYAIMVGGWSAALYAMQWTYRHLGELLADHKMYVAGYLAAVGFVSFAVCYRLGPVTNERSLHIMTWTLQLLALLFIYNGTQISTISFAMVLVAITMRLLHYPVRAVAWVCRKVGFKTPFKQPPEVRLLTEEEYQQQGEVETQRALESLRELCRSPDFHAWKAVTQLNSPRRFADFVEGSPHLSPQEMSLHSQQYSHPWELEDEWYNSFNEDEGEEEAISNHLNHSE
ncbi:LOW QUALITY PROTEIN: nuclear envelope integral membrane protein 1a-like [Lethenteron reissneri]|uniref:LOW QUALITY PROTEIN: nuclear envelope integral membrane protein 1a-like n=1 Tax=Lethenteron reissneri TaxID=7753 RepID=UPI002AB63FB2|nr:LOW QUALITY PROTEIN: nuclear envelope integral membrane protein 1a-like [Lethenteron reissneri]